MIRLENINFSYKLNSQHKLWAIRNLSLEIARGEWVTVLGANGSGKSTLSKLISGVLLADSGEVWLAGVNTAKQYDSGWLGVGLVLSRPQEQLIAPTVEEELAFGQENLGLEAAEIRARVEQALAWLGLENYAKRAVADLSGGEQQRVVLASVLAMNPRYLILDEPAAFLAPGEAEQLWQLIYRLNRRQGVTIIWLSQRVEQARGAKRVLVLHQGRLCADEPGDKMFSDSYDWEGWGLELPPLITLSQKLLAEGFSLNLPIFTIDELLSQL